ncbi:MAG: hypothetical protein K8T25_24070 [Planctomycetia bacterium]|nr:hypothetical protein [Planctomycetia bacterium]
MKRYLLCGAVLVLILSGQSFAGGLFAMDEGYADASCGCGGGYAYNAGYVGYAPVVLTGYRAARVGWGCCERPCCERPCCERPCRERVCCERPCREPRCCRAPKCCVAPPVCCAPVCCAPACCAPRCCRPWWQCAPRCGVPALGPCCNTGCTSCTTCGNPVADCGCGGTSVDVSSPIETSNDDSVISTPAGAVFQVNE